jgi:predicted RNase H-like HicB family nuclease
MMNIFRRRADEPGEYRLRVEFAREEDGRWIADILDLPGVMAYGASQHEAAQKAAALALRVIADRLENDEKALSPTNAMKLCLVPA